VKKSIKIVLAAASLALVAALAVPVQAAPLVPRATGAAVFEFDGNAQLPAFPCVGTCNGNFAGKVNGTLTVDGDTIAVSGANITSNGFSYNEPAATCPAQGTASGPFNISGGSAVPGGTGSVNGTFTWQRVGATAVLTIQATVTVNGKSASVSGTSVAAFETDETPVTCDGDPVGATVVGSGELGA
jgi:hypothetical protein